MESGIGAAEYQRRYDIRHALEEQEREEILRERMRVDEVLTGVLIDEHINERLCGCPNPCDCDDVMYERRVADL